MKKSFLALSAVILTLLAFTSSAEAGRYIRYVAGYNHCGHPVYAYRYVPTYHHSSRGYCQPNHGHSHFRSSVLPRSSSRIYSRPSYRYSYSRSRSNCR